MVDEPLLPAEIFGVIITKLQYDVSSLKAISLTCQQWHHFTRPLIFKAVRITIRQALPSSDPTTILPLFNLPGFNPDYTTNITLQSSTQILLKAPSPSFGLPLDKFSNLHTLTLSRIHIAEFPPLPYKDAFSRSITTLRIYCLHYNLPKDVVKFILGFPSLRCLSVYPIQSTRFIPDYFALGQETPPPQRLPPIQCINARFDVSEGYTVPLLDALSAKQTVNRLSVVINLERPRDWLPLSQLFDSYAKEVPVWDFGLKWAENLTILKPLAELDFHKLVNLRSLRLSLLDFQTTRKHALTFLLIHYLFESSLKSPTPFLQVHSLKLSFESFSTSRRDINQTLAIQDGLGIPLNLRKFDMDTVCRWPGKKRKESFHHLDSRLKNFWSLCDAKIPQAFPNIQEVVVEVRGLTRARFVGNYDDLPPFPPGRVMVDGGGQELDQELEMGVGELKALVTNLFPLCVKRGVVVTAELGSVAKVWGLWEDHNCGPE